MSRLPELKRDGFALKKVKFNNPGISASFIEKRVVDGKPQEIVNNRIAKYDPHPDLISYKNELKHYLAKCYGFHIGFDIAEKYLTGAKKQKSIDARIEHYDKIEVTGVSISGTEDLIGAVISGKIESNNGSKIAMNTPRIVFSSEKIGYEKEVKRIVDLIEMEAFKYLYEGKSSQGSLFDQGDVNDIDVEDAKSVEVA